MPWRYEGGMLAQKLLVITDAWTPQTNGVVTTLCNVAECLIEAGLDVEIVHGGLFHTWPLPTYPEIRIARDPWVMKQILKEVRPDYVHVATEGPLGIYARVLLNKLRVPFTTSVHTKFPEYVHKRIRLPLAVGYRILNWFHAPAVRTLCTTMSHKLELESWGLGDLVVWGRGVNINKFREMPREVSTSPRCLYVGRVAVEKNVEAFLSLDMEVDKVIVGDGPMRQKLQKRYPDAHWLGYRYGEDLVREYARADVFVFPSLTDTFGLVMLEANACGTPVAAFPVMGPVDVVTEGVNGALDNELSRAIDRALVIPRTACRAHAESHSWYAVAGRLRANLAAIKWDASSLRGLR